MFVRFVIAAALCMGVAACAAPVSDSRAQQASDSQVSQAAAQECAQQNKPDTEAYNACVGQKTKEKSPHAEQMRRIRSDEDDSRKNAQDPQRDYMSR